MAEPPEQAATSPADEARLVAALRDGDDAAYEMLVRTFGPRMLAVIGRLVRDEHDAHDAAQDAFIQVFRGIASFQGTSRLGTWLHRIAVNAALMKLRSRRRDARSSACDIDELLPKYLDDGHRAATLPAWSGSVEDRLLRAETRAVVRDCIDELPDDYRLVLMLRDIEDMDTEEAAHCLGVNTGVVKTRLHRARQALRTLLEQRFAATGAV